MNTSPQKNCRNLLLLLTIVCLIGLALSVGRLLKLGPPSSTHVKATPTSVTSSVNATAVIPARSTAVDSRSGISTELRETGALEQSLRDALNRLRAKNNAESHCVLLRSLKGKLLAADSNAKAVEAIVGFLDSNQDADTGLAFRVGPNHALVESPTLRTALLDWLGQLDAAASADYAAKIFEAMASPEEYAVALRNFARGRPQQRDELRSHFDRPLPHGPWAAQPTAGYLESFDVVPHLGDATFVDPLSGFLGPSARTSLRHASLVALDRLVLANPSGAFVELLDTPALQDQPLVRASFLARADVREARQRELVERYLLSTSRSDRELDKFVRLFPNANRFVSHNLLTDAGGCSLAELASLDAAALEQIRKWQAESRFSRLAARLKQMEQRLQEQVHSAVKAGHFAWKH